MTKLWHFEHVAMFIITDQIEEKNENFFKTKSIFFFLIISMQEGVS